MCLPIVGAIISGVGAAMGMAQQAAAYNAQAKAQERQARIQENIGAYESKRQEEAVQRALGSQRAGYAASGVSLEGTAADVLDESATEGALDVAAIRWNAGMRADTSRYDAKVSRMNARGAKGAMPFAFLSPVLKSAAKIQGAFATAGA